jgi:cytochrome c556
MKVLAIAAIAAMLATSLVTPAGADPIADREANMKARAQQLQVLGPIVQGNSPFDAAQVQAALEQLHALAEATDVDVFWPEGSQGGKSAPAIWSDRAGFIAANEKFTADTAAAVDAKPADLAALQAVFGPVAGNCGSCHRDYRS